MNRIRRFAPLDILIILLVVAQAAGALLLAARPAGEPAARVVLDGRVVARLRLGQDRVFEVGDAGVTVEVRNGRVRVAESDCPRKVCVRTGWISRPGRAIVCAPNRLLVEVVGDAGLDAETW
ncbi:NusG domain II-containing protein [candidate division WOR-3 bacterium]|nr:NusG domain II-containing protein [candidate division WOR-3 bacterium]